MPRVELHDDRIDVHTLWSEKDLIKQIPGARYDGERRTWTVPQTWASCCQLRGVFGQSLDVGPLMREWSIAEYQTRVERAMALRDVLALDGPDTWRPYQLADIQFLLTAGDCLLANDPGTGKTVSTLTAARAMGEAALPMLIICPNSVKRHWEKHFTRWFPEATPYVCHGSTPNKRKVIDKASIDPTAAIIINIEAVRFHTRLAPYGSTRLNRCADCGHIEDDTTAVTSARCEVHLKELNYIPFKTVVLDEAHRVKEPTAKQTRAIWYVGHQDSVRTRWALTGTPIANHVGDLWSVMHFVHPAEYPAKTTFVDRYALFTWNDYGTMSISDVRPDTKAELFKFLDPRMRRMLKEIVLPQLPPKVWTTHEAEMTPKQRKMYEELEAEMYTRTSDGQLLLVTNNMTKNLRLIQLASSSARIEEELTGEIDEVTGEEKIKQRVFLEEPSSKIDVMVEQIEAHEGKQVVVSAMSRQLIDLAYERLVKLGFSAARITGEIGEWERNVNLEEFQAGRVHVLLFTLGAGGVGIDMTAASVMIRIQRSYSMIENIQGLGRIDRIGAEVHDSLDVIDVIASGTVEDDQLERLRDKEERLETIVRDRAARQKAGLDTTAYDAEIARISEMSLLPPMEDDA